MRLKLPLTHRGASYARLSPQDESFLAFEKPDLHMHVGAVAIFDGASFRAADGEVDVEGFRRYIASRLPFVAQCHQKLARMPIFGRRIWVDDPEFAIERHVREVRIAAPGGDAELRALASEIFSAPLDRGKPLWELCVVQGYHAPGGEDAFALICRAHHAMLDGLAGIDFIGALLTRDAVQTQPVVPAWRAAPVPGRTRLVVAEAARCAVAPLHLVRAIVRLSHDAESRETFRDRTLALVRLITNGVRGTTRTPLIPVPTPQRAVAWASTDGGNERMIRARLGGTRDDVTLSAATGAVRAFLLRCGLALPTLRIRAMVPTNMRTRAERGGLGNRVSMLIVDLPVAEGDARRRLETITETVTDLKQTKQNLGADVLAQIDSVTGTLAQRASMWLANVTRAYNLCVTTIPGPPTPLWALESKLLALYPLAPIFGGQRCNLAALSYAGTLHWGVNYAGGDDADVRRFLADVVASFDALTEAAAAAPPRLALVTPQSAADDDIVRSPKISRR